MDQEGFVSMFDPDDAVADQELEQRFMTSERRLSDPDDMPSMRPLSWDEYFGQDKIKANLNIYIKAAQQRGEALDHVLLYGPPGLGKTTMAAIIASEMGVNMKITSGPAIERQGDLAAILTNLAPGDVLFIDEIHRLNSQVEEILYPAMEDYALDIMLGKGPSARSIRLDLPQFTLIGATTRVGLLTSPLRDRFGMIERLELYRPDQIAQILERNAHVLGMDISQNALHLISGRCRGTPRVAIRILRRLRDFAQVMDKTVIDEAVVNQGLQALEIDELGLDRTDLELMHAIAQYFGGGPVGLDTLAAMTGEDATTIEDVYEPYLMQLGFISKTPRGRILNAAAYEHLKLTPRSLSTEETQLSDPPARPATDQLAFDFGLEEESE